MFACANHIIVSPSLNLPRPGWKTREERVVAVTAQREPPPYSPFSCVIFDLCCLQGEAASGHATVLKIRAVLKCTLQHGAELLSLTNCLGSICLAMSKSMIIKYNKFPTNYSKGFELAVIK